MDYYCINHSRKNEQWEEYIKSYENGYVSMQYEYGIQESNSSISERWNRFMEIKIGDVLFLQNDSLIYAWGYAIAPRKINKNGESITPIILKAQDIRANKDHANYRSDKKSNAYIIFDDCQCFYENLEDGKDKWGQRIDVDKWRDYLEEGIKYIPVDGRGITKSIPKKQAEEYVKELSGNENFKFEDEPMKDTSIEKYIKLLEANKNIILTGAPGTGKTYMAKEIAMKMILKTLKKNKDLTQEEKEKLKECSNFVQFHPSYDYTDFVEGLRPVKNDDDKNIGFERKDGIFKEFCKRAKNNLNANYVFIIDEINRGEISKIFGELFYSIDPGYRGEKGKTKTQYSNLIEDEDDKEFYVPENVYIIGTMNDIDRSVESMDFAIRRRFAWVEIKAKDRISMWEGQIDKYKDEAEKRMNNLNKAIIEKIEGLSSGYHIGPSYFLKLKDGEYNGDFVDLWNYHIYGVLFEYLRAMPDTKNTMGKLQAAYNLTKYEEDNNTDNDDLNNSEDSQ